MTIDFNSTINQYIKGKFIERNVIQNVNQVIDFVLKSEDKQDWEDEICDLVYNYDYESAVINAGWDFDHDNNCYFHPLNEDLGTFETAQEVCENEDLDSDILDIYEFWSVSDYMADKLKQNDQVVVGFLGMNVWRRCTTGQEILLDYVISVICEDMGILEGQK